MKSKTSILTASILAISLIALAFVIPQLFIKDVDLSLTNANSTQKTYHIAVDAVQNTNANQPITFGLPFASGELDYDDYLKAEVKIGNTTTTVPVQIDKKASHCATRDRQNILTKEFLPKDTCTSADRSLKHGIISLNLPKAMTTEERAEITLSVIDSPPPVAQITFPNTLDLKTNLNLDGKSYTADLNTVPSSQFINPPQAGTSNVQVTSWLDGSIVREWIVRVPFADASNNEHAHLTARYNIRHYASGHTKVDAIVENNWAFEPNHASYTYKAEVYINGVKKYEDTNLNHFVHARWKVSLWAENYPELHIMHDPMHLLATRVLPNYDQDLVYNISEKSRNDYDAHWQRYKPSMVGGILKYDDKKTYCFKSKSSTYIGPCNDQDIFPVTTNTMGPMGIGGIVERGMPNTGGRGDIAPLPKWTALYALDQRHSFKQIMLGIADGAGSWHIHFRDQNTDLPLSIEDHPKALYRWPFSSGSGQISSCPTSENCSRAYIADNAHQPQLSFIPYVVTGDFYHMEELQFWSTYNLVSLVVSYRGSEKGLFERTTQTRAAGWSLRTLVQTAYITPDDHNLKSHYLTILKNNIDQYQNIYVSNPSQSNSFGAVGTGTNPIVSPWMQDYVSWATGYASNFGYESILPFAKWKAKFPVKRMGYDNSSFCWVFAGSYHLLMAPSKKIPVSSTEPTVTVMRGKGTPGQFTQDNFVSIDSLSKYSNTATNGGVDIGGGFSTSQRCGSPEQFAEQGLREGEMWRSNADSSYVSQLGPSLAAAVDVNATEAGKAWALYSQRDYQPTTFSTNPQWNIVPISATPTYNHVGFPGSATYPDPPICGNSTQEIGEQCDDGNTSNGDGCSDRCITEVGGGDIVINARGTNGKEKIALFINNAPVQFWNLTNNFQGYTYTPKTEIIVNELSVHFLNDTWEPQNNINYDVQIPYITVNGKKYESQHADVTSTGSWDQNNWCAPGKKRTQWLNCNGFFTYNVPIGNVLSP